jgi:hypothetical protein
VARLWRFQTFTSSNYSACGPDIRTPDIRTPDPINAFTTSFINQLMLFLVIFPLLMFDFIAIAPILRHLADFTR